MKTGNQGNVIDFTPAKSAEQVFIERLTMVGAEDREEVLRRISEAVAQSQQVQEVKFCA